MFQENTDEPKNAVVWSLVRCFYIRCLCDRAEGVLGILLNALRYLAGASPNSYLLLSELERSDEVNYIRGLEKKNYVKVQTVQGLPDGMQKSTKFLRVIPVGDGLELQRCVVDLKHNI